MICITPERLRALRRGVLVYLSASDASIRGLGKDIADRHWHKVVTRIVDASAEVVKTANDGRASEAYGKAFHAILSAGVEADDRDVLAAFFAKRERYVDHIVGATVRIVALEFAFAADLEQRHVDWICFTALIVDEPRALEKIHDSGLYPSTECLRDLTREVQKPWGRTWRDHFEVWLPTWSAHALRDDLMRARKPSTSTRQGVGL